MEVRTMKRVVAVLAILSVLVAGSALAQKGPHGWGLRVGKLLLLRDTLKLTDDQVAKLKDLNLAFQKESTKLQADLKIARLEFFNLISEERVPDVSKAQAKLEEINRLRGRLQKARLSHHIEIRKVLTDEQWKTLKELRFKRACRRMKERMHPKREMMGPPLKHGPRPMHPMPEL